MKLKNQMYIRIRKIAERTICHEIPNTYSIDIVLSVNLTRNPNPPSVMRQVRIS